MNTIFFNGNLASDAKVSKINDKDVINFTVIVNLSKDEKPLAFSCSYWRTSENLMQYLTKGKKVGISGHIRKIEATQKGEVIYINTNVTVERLELLGGKDDATQTPVEPTVSTPEQQVVIQSEDLPF